MLPKVKQILDRVIEQFRGSDIPEAIAYSMFPIPNIPSAKWSLMNHLIMFFSGTKDARGYRQWHNVNRFVKKGAKSFTILVPYFKKNKNDKGEEVPVLVGFVSGNVFRLEDTDGQTLDYQNIELPKLPLLKRASEWGISVTAIPGNYEHYGYYQPNKKVIALATPEEKTFFHELVHVADEKIKGKLKQGQDPLQEIIAELGAHALCNIVGKDGNKYFGNSYHYIEHYAKDLKITPQTAVLRVVSDVEKILNLILGKE
ncbi:MAG: antirestriction protein [Ignavibacteriae bacterium]|nr:antirestriction protein [Ignavibacteriota bacterium]